ncbi:hypothetical protein [Xanthobacter sp.]|uniref:hypothetical protein n=1 Tax=Xanthobacter sp. TaxID=35809 RepID=UPI0026011B9B|nr:hypothetical protein [Xanthobacter sp.]
MVTHRQFAVRSYATRCARSHKPNLMMGRVDQYDGLRLHRARCNFPGHVSLFGGRNGGSSDHSLWRDRGPDIGKAALSKNLFGMTSPPDLSAAEPKGNVFGGDHMPTDGSAMFIHWQAGQAHQVAFPTDFARTAPRARN